MNSDYIGTFIAIRKGNRTPYRYDIYFDNNDHTRHLGKVKANKGPRISQECKNLVSNSKLKKIDKKNLESFVEVLNVNNNESIRFALFKYNSEGKQKLYIDPRK